MKIGYSDDPDRRLKELQTGNPYKIKICFALPCATKKDAVRMEANLHRLVTAKYRRLCGEWFLIYGDIIKLIRDAQKLTGKPDIDMEGMRNPNKKRPRIN